MPTHIYGFKSHRDHFVIDFEQNNLKNRIQELLKVKLDDEFFGIKYKLKEWKWQKASTQLKKKRICGHIWIYVRIVFLIIGLCFTQN